MASTTESIPVAPPPGRLFYCHRCSHQWRKLEDSEFNCPQCREGFIEDINDTAISDDPQNPNADQIDGMITRIMSQMPSSRITSSSSATRARSRSPRLSFYMRADRSGASGSSSSSSSSVPRLSDFQFDLDDLMNSFLSSPRPPPISQARLHEIPVMTVTDEHTSTQCSICFDEFHLDEAKVRQLPCKHLYHELCIFPWLRINGTCPVCRSRLNNGTDSDSTPPSREASRYDDILRFMRLRRHQVRREAVEPEQTTNVNELPPQYAVRGRPRSSASSRHDASTGGPSRPQAGYAFRGRSRFVPSVRDADSPANDESNGRDNVREFVRRYHVRFPDDTPNSEDGPSFAERRRTTLRFNIEAPSQRMEVDGSETNGDSSLIARSDSAPSSQMLSLRSVAAAARSRAILTSRRTRRNAGAREVASDDDTIREALDSAQRRRYSAILREAVEGPPTTLTNFRNRARREVAERTNGTRRPEAGVAVNTNESSREGPGQTQSVEPLDSEVIPQAPNPPARISRRFGVTDDENVSLSLQQEMESVFLNAAERMRNNRRLRALYSEPVVDLTGSEEFLSISPAIPVLSSESSASASSSNSSSSDSSSNSGSALSPIASDDDSVNQGIDSFLEIISQQLSSNEE